MATMLFQKSVRVTQTSQVRQEPSLPDWLAWASSHDIIRKNLEDLYNIKKIAKSAKKGKPNEYHTLFILHEQKTDF